VKRGYRRFLDRISFRSDTGQGDTGSLNNLDFASRSPAPDMPAIDSIEFSASQNVYAEINAKPPVPNRTTLFSGRPQGDGEIVLFDSSRDQSVHPVREAGTINRLIISFAGRAPAAESLGAELCLLVFVGDMAMPRAKVKLADLVRQRGARPLNLLRKRGEALRLALVDPAGIWSEGSPHIEIALEWA
jgi:hypothetical protein